MRPLILLFAISFSATLLFGQTKKKLKKKEYHATVYMKNGKSFEAIMNMPRFSSNDSPIQLIAHPHPQVRIKNLERGSKEKIKLDSFERFTLYSPLDTFHFWPTRVYDPNFFKSKLKVTKRPKILLQVWEKDDIKLLRSFSSLKVKKDKRIAFTTLRSRSECLYYVMRPGDEYPTFIGEDREAIILRGEDLREWAPQFFSDCPAIVEKIKSKELNFPQVEEIMEYYLTHCFSPGSE